MMWLWTWKQSKKDCWTIQWTRLALEHRDKEEENDMFDSYDRIELADNVEDDVDRSSEVDEADDFESSFSDDDKFPIGPISSEW